MTLAAIALGANLGAPEETFALALSRLRSLGRIVATSSRYRTRPVGPPQPDYQNAAALLETALSPEELLRALLAIEASLGRDRTHEQRWGPRLLDLDLLFYGALHCDLPGLTLPHPRMHERRFVLLPLSEIAPDWRHPALGKNIRELLTALGPAAPGEAEPLS